MSGDFGHFVACKNFGGQHIKSWNMVFQKVYLGVSKLTCPSLLFVDQSSRNFLPNTENTACFWLQHFGEGPLNFGTWIIKLYILLIMWQSFTVISWRSSRSRDEIENRVKNKENISSKTLDCWCWKLNACILSVFVVWLQAYCEYDAKAINRGALQLALQSLDTASDPAIAATLWTDCLTIWT